MGSGNPFNQSQKSGTFSPECGIDTKKGICDIADGDLEVPVVNLAPSSYAKTMKIYTRNGDSGQTRLIGGAEISKADLRIEAYGTIDELNAVLGLCRTEAQLQKQTRFELEGFEDELQLLQNELFNAGGLLACENAAMLTKLPHLSTSVVQKLEQSIDEKTSVLPPLKEFILPGGTELASRLHLARTICRRAERRLVEFTDSQEKVPQEYGEIVVFLNRLSDWCFTAARWANSVFREHDHVWKKGTPG